MIWAVEWKRLFSALKIFKIGFIGVGLRSKIPHFSEIFVVDIIFFTSGTKVVCVENFFSSIDYIQI